MRRLKRERALLISCLALSMVLHLLYGIEGMKQYEAFEYQIERQAAQLLDKQEQIEMLETIIIHMDDNKRESEIKNEPAETSLGEFKVTYYCPCAKCCGKTDGITASGTLAQEGITVAADWTVIEPGTKLYIDGVGQRVVEDKGGAIKGNRIDVFMDSHERALQAGVHEAQVYLISEEVK